MKQLLIAALLALAGAPVTAQQEVQIEIRIFALLSSFAPPPWSVGADVADTSEIFRKQGKGPDGTDFFVFEMIPKGETFDNWTRFYALTAETGLNGDVQGYMNGQINRYMNACTDLAVALKRKPTASSRVFILYCAAYADRPDTGEVAFFKMEKSGDTLVKLYQHERVPAFDMSGVQDVPPLPFDALRAGLVRVGSLKLSPP